ncbi:glycosyltransferase family 4 protein [Meridianimarinicoccus sp. RP-17]|uniref:glycosyltransferase family 4 protein n=1 Tax=Meridianimarinicoccus zhengii TaxID=2056810 RepID=UPI000DAE5B6D|nr:glycosyltransferase family 4 protein [Phycocomes zhengii]
MRKAALALPGSIDARTGGTIYDARVLDSLRVAGRDMALLELPGGFPFPDSAAMETALAQLAALPADRPVIVDGLAFGALDPAGIDRIAAPIVALVHHPLALETGMPPQQAAHLARTEAANLARAAHVLVPSPHTAAVLQRDYGVAADRLTVARPGIDRSGTTPRPVSPPLILSVGLLAPRKGHDVLLRALAAIADRDWQAVIVGRDHDGRTAGELAGLARDLGLADRVRFAGELSQGALDALYAAASVFALATRYEGYGMVFAEALVRGLPVVSCRTGAVPDTVPKGAGVLVAVDDVPAFAAALARLLDDPAHRAALADAAARYGVTLPDWADTAARFGAVLDKV